MEIKEADQIKSDYTYIGDEDPKSTIKESAVRSALPFLLNIYEKRAKSIHRGVAKDIVATMWKDVRTREDAVEFYRTNFPQYPQSLWEILADRSMEPRTEEKKEDRTLWDVEDEIMQQHAEALERLLE